MKRKVCLSEGKCSLPWSIALNVAIFFPLLILIEPCFFRVQLQKMTIIRPSPEVARYTMVFHKRDSGNQVNKDRSVEVYEK